MTGPADQTAALTARLGDLERTVRRLQAALAGGALAICAVALVAFRSAQPTQGGTIVTARRLVLTDSLGRPAASIQVGRAFVRTSDNRFQEARYEPALNISMASEDGASVFDSLTPPSAELRLSRQLFTVFFGGRLGPPGASSTDDIGSGMALSAKPALELTSRGAMMFRVDPGSRFFRPVSAGASP
jgi:hypothetical protein